MGTFADSCPFLAIIVSLINSQVGRNFVRRELKVDVCLKNIILLSVFLHFRLNFEYQTMDVAVKSYRICCKFYFNSHALGWSFYTEGAVVGYFSYQAVILLLISCKVNRYLHIRKLRGMEGILGVAVLVQHRVALS